MNLDKISIGRNPPDEVNVIIEIPQGGNPIKYEIDKESGAMFVDGGNVWASMRALRLKYFRPYVKEEDLVQQDYRYSVGCGLRYNTPIGPIRVDYGIPIKREVDMDKAGRIHISLGQIF